MMNFLFAVMFFASFASAAALGRMRELSAAILEGGRNAVELLLTIAGSMAFFSGLMRICEKSGVARGLSRLLYPVLRWIFPQIDRIYASSSSGVSPVLCRMMAVSTPCFSSAWAMDIFSRWAHFLLAFN